MKNPTSETAPLLRLLFNHPYSSVKLSEEIVKLLKPENQTALIELGNVFNYICFDEKEYNHQLRVLFFDHKVFNGYEGIRDFIFSWYEFEKRPMLKINHPTDPDKGISINMTYDHDKPMIALDPRIFTDKAFEHWLGTSKPKPNFKPEEFKRKPTLSYITTLAGIFNEQYEAHQNIYGEDFGGFMLEALEEDLNGAHFNIIIDLAYLAGMTVDANDPIRDDSL